MTLTTYVIKLSESLTAVRVKNATIINVMIARVIMSTNRNLKKEQKRCGDC